jgi:hypothetical protein
MKNLAWTIINYLFFFYYQIKFSRIIYSLNTKKNLVFIDIDNTIADTWPTLKSTKFKNEFERHLNIPVHFGMKKFIESNFKNDNYKIIYLSARNYRFIGVTNKWLSTNEFNINDFSVVLVNKPSLKLYFLKKAINNNFNVIYIDDLSYNHENYKVKFYTPIISIIEKMKITYIGYDKILEINNVA